MVDSLLYSLKVIFVFYNQTKKSFQVIPRIVIPSDASGIAHLYRVVWKHHAEKSHRLANDTPTRHLSMFDRIESKIYWTIITTNLITLRYSWRTRSKQ